MGLCGGCVNSDTDPLHIRRGATYILDMASCAFCRRPHIGVYAVTSCGGDPADAGSWGRGTLALCQQCRDALREAGDAGRVLKGTNQRWYLGHGVGRFESEAAPR